MTGVDLQEYKNRLAGLPADRFVGSMVWFTVAGTVERPDGRTRRVVPVRVSHDQLEAWFEDLGLDADFLPPRIKRVDAFRAATGQARREYNLADGQFAELQVVEVRSDAEQVIRHVVCQVRDERREEVSHEHMATLKFIRGGRTAKGKRHSGDHWKGAILHAVTGLDRQEVKAFIADIDQRYTDLSANLQAAAIRGVLRNYLTFLNAIPMKTSGGLYFVHKSRQDSVDGLQQLARRIGQGCSLEQFPLIDTDDSRMMLTEAFQTEVEDDCRLLLKEIAELNEKAQIRGGKIPPTKYAEINGRFKEIADRAEEYRLLGLAQGRAAAALDLTLDAVMDMANRLDIPRRGR